MTIDVGVSGVYKNVPDLWAGVSGAWKKVSDAWVGVGGVWKQFYTSVAINLLGLDPYSLDTAPTDTTATYSLTSAGLETATGLSDNTWLLSGAASDYECRATVNSGTLTSGTTGTWLNLGTTRTWTRTNTFNTDSVQTVDMTVEIGLAGTSTALVSSNVIITAEIIT